MATRRKWNSLKEKGKTLTRSTSLRRRSCSNDDNDPVEHVKVDQLQSLALCQENANGSSALEDINNQPCGFDGKEAPSIVKSSGKFPSADNKLGDIDGEEVSPTVEKKTVSISEEACDVSDDGTTSFVGNAKTEIVPALNKPCGFVEKEPSAIAGSAKTETVSINNKPCADVNRVSPVVESANNGTVPIDDKPCDVDEKVASPIVECATTRTTVPIDSKPCDIDEEAAPSIVVRANKKIVSIVNAPCDVIEDEVTELINNTDSLDCVKGENRDNCMPSEDESTDGKNQVNLPSDPCKYEVESQSMGTQALGDHEQTEKVEVGVASCPVSLTQPDVAQITNVEGESEIADTEGELISAQSGESVESSAEQNAADGEVSVSCSEELPGDKKAEVTSDAQENTSLVSHCSDDPKVASPLSSGKKHGHDTIGKGELPGVGGVKVTSDAQEHTSSVPHSPDDQKEALPLRSEEGFEHNTIGKRELPGVGGVKVTSDAQEHTSSVPHSPDDPKEALPPCSEEGFEHRHAMISKRELPKDGGAKVTSNARKETSSVSHSSDDPHGTSRLCSEEGSEHHHDMIDERELPAGVGEDEVTSDARRGMSSVSSPLDEPHAASPLSSEGGNGDMIGQSLMLVPVQPPIDSKTKPGGKDRNSSDMTASLSDDEGHAMDLRSNKTNSQNIPNSGGLDDIGEEIDYGIDNSASPRTFLEERSDETSDSVQADSDMNSDVLSSGSGMKEIAKGNFDSENEDIVVMPGYFPGKFECEAIHLESSTISYDEKSPLMQQKIMKVQHVVPVENGTEDERDTETPEFVSGTDDPRGMGESVSPHVKDDVQLPGGVEDSLTSNGAFDIEKVVAIEPLYSVVNRTGLSKVCASDEIGGEKSFCDAEDMSRCDTSLGKEKISKAWKEVQQVDEGSHASNEGCHGDSSSETRLLPLSEGVRVASPDEDKTSKGVKSRSRGSSFKDKLQAWFQREKGMAKKTSSDSNCKATIKSDDGEKPGKMKAKEKANGQKVSVMQGSEDADVYENAKVLAPLIPGLPSSVSLTETHNLDNSHTTDSVFMGQEASSSRGTDVFEEPNGPNGSSPRMKRQKPEVNSPLRRRKGGISGTDDLSSCPDLSKLDATAVYAKPHRVFHSVRAVSVYEACKERCHSCKEMKLACVCWMPEPDIYENDPVARATVGVDLGSGVEDSGMIQDEGASSLRMGRRNRSLASLLYYKRRTVPNQQEKELLDAVEKFEDIKEELKATALTIQEAISRLQHEYKYTEESTDDGNHGDLLPPPKPKLVRLCSRNRRCLSKLLSAEWKDGKTLSVTSSIGNSETSTDQNDTDCSDSGGDVVSASLEAEDILGSNESFRDADGVGEKEEDRAESVVTDFNTCQDFVQGLAIQVQAMQEALRKSKDNLDRCGIDDNPIDGPSENMNGIGDCSTVTTREEEFVGSQGTAVDDGDYETPIKGPAMVLVSDDRHSHSDYEEVSDISDQNSGQRSPLTNGYHDKNYINISTYERTDSLQNLASNGGGQSPLTNNGLQIKIKNKGPQSHLSNNALQSLNNNKETTTTITKQDSVGNNSAIYEFPPGIRENKPDSEEKQPEVGEITDEEPKAQYKYDGPLVFDEEDKKDIFKIREKDKVKKWDPVPILRELYDSLPPPAQTSWNGTEATSPPVKTGECSMEGYMEKLPMGRRRASLMKKWKRRYFRCKGGNLFYYEDHKTKKSLGYLHLVGGKVTEISNKVLEVTDMRGRVLLLRCASKMEFEDWKAILNAETGFYLCQRSSFINTVTKRVVIVDLGSCSVRAGILSDCETPYPQRFFPSAAAVSSKSKDCIAYGFDAFTPANRANAKLVFPLRRPPRLEQFKLNISLIEGLLDTAFTELKIDPRAYSVLLVVPFSLGSKATEKLVEMVFDQFHVEGIFLREQTLMSLYSYKATTGIVVNIGEKLDVVPIVDGFIVEKGVCRLPFGGRQITETLTRLLTESGHRFFSEVESVVSRYLKEKACFVAQDYQSELKFCSLDPELCSTFLALDKFNIPDGTRTIKLDYSRFRSAEGIFHPECWGKDHSGLHSVVYKAIQSCSVELRRHMCKNIYLCGGTSLLPGLAERLRSELIKLLPKGNSVRVHASAERYHAAYHGACTLAPLSAYDNLCVTKDEWKQLGAASLAKWQNV